MLRLPKIRVLMAMERGGRISVGVWVLVQLLLLQLLVQSTSAALLTLGDSLATNQTWVSENGTFTMGFHPIPANSSSLYLGVWYTGVPVVPVWLANRERAVKSGATLTLNNAGSLVLSDGNQVWNLSNTTTKSDGVVGGAFLENGNIQLRNASNGTVWDSFDYPTDTLLPGLTVQVGRKFTSWKGNNDPSSGLYTFEMMLSGELHFLWNGTRVYYNSGAWVGSHYANPPQLGRTTPPDTFHFDNSTGSPRFWYTTSGRAVTADITLKRFRLNPDGIARQHIWVIGSNSWQTFISAPVEPCDSHRVCGQNSLCTSSNYIPGCSCLPGFEPVSGPDQDYWLQGCKRHDPDDRCSNTTSAPDSFQALTDVTIEEDDDLQSFVNDTETTCRGRCMQNCSCGGYSFSGEYSNCTLHSTMAVLFNARSSNDSNFSPFLLRYRPIPSSDQVLEGDGASFRGVKLVVTVVIASVFVVAVIVIALVWWLVRTKRRAVNLAMADFSAVGLLRFSYKELVDATGNFGRQLGSGGFGAVYKGTLSDKSEVAVKTLAKLRQGEQEFRTEVAVIGTVQHINLVRLRGFCAEGDHHRALVYEYIPNGSLEKYLFARPGTEEINLDWTVRMNIALGAARGISYLHHECRSNIIHCDIKPENILLDKDFTPKVSDFGLAKLMGKDVSRVITNIRGTRGYLAPEWLTNCSLTSKVDVYSFGMTLLELIAGRRTVDFGFPTAKWFYAVWAFKELARGEPLMSLVDERLVTDERLTMDERLVMDESVVMDEKLVTDESAGSLEEQLRRALHVGLWCTQDDPGMRPTMSDVVKMLEGTLPVVDAPAPPSYIAQTDIEAISGEHGTSSSAMKAQYSFEYTQTFSAR